MPKPVIEATSSIELTGFELIEAAPGKALLRVAARAPVELAADRAVTLVVTTEGHRHRFVPLPSPPDPSGLLRAAYTAPLALLEPPVEFALELGDGSLVELPAPTPRADVSPSRGHPARPMQSAVDAAVGARETAEGRAAEAERAHAEAQRERDEAGAELKQTRAELEQALAEVERALAEVERAAQIDAVRALELAATPVRRQPLGGLSGRPRPSPFQMFLLAFGVSVVLVVHARQGEARRMQPEG